MKTYLTPGLLGFRLLLPVGKAWITIDFTPGKHDGLTTRWASFSTSDRSLQRLIEGSRDYMSGKIKTGL